MERATLGRPGSGSPGTPPARRWRFTASLAALLLAGCGYAFSQRYVARGGAARIQVRAFENRSTEPELGAAVTAALRAELARRGAAGGEGALAVIDGEVRAGEPAPTSTRLACSLPPPACSEDTPEAERGRLVTAVSTWRIAVEVRARLLADGAETAEHVARQEADFIGGGDPLETEGRRALALRRAADDAAREILRAFER